MSWQEPSGSGTVPLAAGSTRRLSPTNLAALRPVTQSLAWHDARSW